MTTTPAASTQIDVRAPRFIAAVTSVVLAAGLLLSSGWILLAQTAVFAVGAFVGLAYSPYGVAFRRFVAPRLGPAVDREPPASLRFAQLVGFGFAGVAAIGYFASLPLLGAVAAGLALTAALLNATTGFCLGCEFYLLAVRASHHFPSRASAVRLTEGV